ncbi:MAG: CHAT domain-containing protein, partial [Acidobacteriota bacterium]
SIAIKYLERALAILEPTQLPSDWPETWPELGRAWAEAWRSLLLAWADQPASDYQPSLERALAALGYLLEFFSPAAAPWERARILMFRGDFLRNRVAGDHEVNLEQSVADYREALQLLGSGAPRDLHWDALMGLGHSLCNRVKGDRELNLKEALVVYEVALSLCDRQTSPLDWGETLLAHANALVLQAHGDRGAQVERALAEYDLLLDPSYLKDAPSEWAFAQMERASARVIWERGDRGDNSEEALTSLRRALEIWTPENNPVRWAIAQTTLGNALTFRVLGDPRANVESALEAYDKALSVLEPNRFPFEWGNAQSQRALVFTQRLSGDPAENEERALDAAEMALRVQTHEAFPRERAWTLDVLGDVYRDRRQGARKENLKRAVEAYEEALLVRRRETMPGAWAVSTIGLARALAGLSELAGHEEHGARARDLLREVLQAADLQLPSSTRKVAAYLLGTLFSREGLWADAAHAFAVALESTAILRQASALRISRHSEIEDSEDLHRRAAFAMARAGDPQSALVTLERGRAQGLGSAVERDRADPERIRHADPRAWALYENAAARIRRIEVEERALPAAGEDDPAVRPSLRAEALQARSEFAAALERIRRLPGLANFLREPDLDDIAATVLRDRPLIYLTPTPEAILALLVRRLPSAPAGETAVEVETVWVESFATSRLDRLLESWRRASDLDGILREITELTLPLAARLRSLGYPGAVLIPSGALGLLPLHAPLLESFEISYAPSARILAAARQDLARRSVRPPFLVGAGGPDPDPEPLAWAAEEINGIAGFFAPSARNTLLGRAATREALLGALPLGSHIHLACHGVFDPREPLNSHLRLAGGELALRDILAGASLGASRLVTLSACHSAVTETERLPDEVLGLPAGFLQAGAPCVIGSLWQVDDLATALLMERLYRFHVDGNPESGEPPMPPVRALRRAQIWLRDVTTEGLAAELSPRRSWRDAFAAEVMNRILTESPGTRPFASPYHWAPFILVGEGT